MAQDHQEAYLLQLAEMLNLQRETCSMTDIILVCGGKEFPAHKSVLSAASNFFQAMFSPRWSEGKRDKTELPTVGAKEMEIILPFLYTGKVEDIDDSALLISLLKSSRFLQINALYDCCCRKISERPHYNRIWDFCNLAFQHEDEGMMKHVLKFLTKHLEQAATSDEFLKLNARQILQIYQHPGVLKCSMDVLIKGLFQWTEVNEEREKTLLQILTTFDLKRTSTAFLSNLLDRIVVKKNCLISQNYLRSVSLLTAEAASRTSPKLLTFRHDDDRQSVVREYDIKENQWSSLKTLPFILDYGSFSVWFDGYVYIMNCKAMGSKKSSANVVKYCPKTNKAESVGALTVHVSGAGAAVLGKYIYIINGADISKKNVSIVQRFDPHTGTCDMVANTNNVCVKPHVFPFAGCLLVIGSNIRRNRSVESYDPELNTWTVITTLPKKFLECAATMYNDRLIVASKKTKTSEFHIYDFLSDTWEQKQFPWPADPPFEIHSVTLGAKRILLTYDWQREVHSFDPELNQLLRQSQPNNISLWLYRLTCVV